MRTDFLMNGFLIESFGRLVGGREYKLSALGTDWARIGRTLVPLDVIDLPAFPGSERAENIRLGLIKPRLYMPEPRHDRTRRRNEESMNERT